MNNKLIYNKKIMILSLIFFIRKKMKKQNLIFFDCRPDPDPKSDPDPLFPDPDPNQNDTDPQHWKLRYENPT